MSKNYCLWEQISKYEVNQNASQDVWRSSILPIFSYLLLDN